MIGTVLSGGNTSAAITLVLMMLMALPGTLVGLRKTSVRPGLDRCANLAHHINQRPYSALQLRNKSH